MLRTAYERISAWLGMRTAGWTTLVASVVALVAGLSFGWLEATVAGASGVLLVLAALLFTIGKPRLAVALQVSERSVVVGEPASGRVLVRTQDGARHFGSRLDLPVGAESASFWLPVMGPHSRPSFEFQVPTEKRGLVVVGPASSVQGDPFALAGRETRWTGTLDVYVHPKTVRLPGRQVGYTHDLEGNPSGVISASDMNFHALRPYVPGDDRRHVHWKSTARAGQLLVRQFEETRMSSVLVALDTGRKSYIDEDEFELAVSVAASLAMHALMGEAKVTILTSEDRLASHSTMRALDDFSTVELSVRGGVADLASSAAEREPAASIVYFITGSSATLAEVRHASSRFDVDSRFVGFRMDAGGELRSRRAANVSVNQVGELAHLPRAVRRSLS